MTQTTAPAAPIILVTTGHPTLHQHPGPDGEAVHPRLGRLLQPRHLSSAHLTAAAGIPWAADNDCFQGLDEVAYVKMLDRLEGLAGCLFVTVPDVVGDSIATRASFDHWAPELERRRMPLGYVAQDGMSLDELAELAPRLAALFLGGSTEWKEGPEAAELAIAAKAAGLWVQWGRVNTRRRFDLIVATGAADSFDGSKWARFRKTYLDGGLAWLVEAADNRRAALEAGAHPIEETRMTDDLPSWAETARAIEGIREERDALIAKARERLADYAVLCAYDRERTFRYGDMARSRRGRELNRLGDELIGLGLSSEAITPAFDLEEGDHRLAARELLAAFTRTLEPRRRRVERETYRHGTRETRATLAAFAALERRLERLVAAEPATALGES